MDRSLSELGRRERQIMDILVRRKRATASEVLSDLPDPPTYSAVRSMLRFLESKGHVLHEWEGPRYVYVPASNPERLKRDAVSHLLRTFFDGSTEAAVSTLLETGERSLTPKELDRLARLIADARKRAIGV